MPGKKKKTGDPAGSVSDEEEEKKEEPKQPDPPGGPPANANVVNAPPTLQPPKPISHHVGTVMERALVDVPFCYLLDKSNWTDFKRALNNCGYTWNLADWMHTVVHQGKQYQEIVAKRPEFTDFFQVPAIPQVEGKVLGPDAKQVFIDLLGFPKNMGEYIKPSLRFCNIERMEFEPEQKLPARQKLWSWIGKCLFGPKAQAGPFYYLTHQCTIYDISYLFKRLWDVMETVTICSLDDEVFNVTHLEFDPSKQDLFTYLEDLRRAVRRLDDLNERLPAAGRVVLTDNYIRSRLIRAARKVPIYRTVIDNLIASALEVWSLLTVMRSWSPRSQTTLP